MGTCFGRLNKGSKLDLAPRLMKVQHATERFSHSYNFLWNTVTSISYLRINHDYHRGRSLGVPNWAAVVQRCCCCGSKRGGAAKPSPYLRIVHPVLNRDRSRAGILNLVAKTKVGVENSEIQLLQLDLVHHKGRSWTAVLPFGCRLWLPAAPRQC